MTTNHNPLGIIYERTGTTTGTTLGTNLGSVITVPSGEYALWELTAIGRSTLDAFPEAVTFIRANFFVANVGGTVGIISKSSEDFLFESLYGIGLSVSAGTGFFIQVADSRSASSRSVITTAWAKKIVTQIT